MKNLTKGLCLILPMALLAILATMVAMAVILHRDIHLVSTPHNKEATLHKDILHNKEATHPKEDIHHKAILQLAILVVTQAIQATPAVTQGSGWEDLWLEVQQLQLQPMALHIWDMVVNMVTLVMAVIVMACPAWVVMAWVMGSSSMVSMANSSMENTAENSSMESTGSMVACSRSGSDGSIKHNLDRRIGYGYEIF